MAGHLLALLALAAAGCSFDRSAAGGGGGDDAGTDAAAAPDAAVAPPAPHLLVTEVKSGPDALEFIEIYNPTCDHQDLAVHYLSDVPGYGLLPSWGDAPPEPGLLNAVVRFPAGEVLASGAVAVVARDGTAFAAEFGTAARFALTNPGTSRVMDFVVFQADKDMSIANTGEPVALFEWDGVSDLVRDVDIVMAGDAPAADRQLVPKQDLAPAGIDGPDSDEMPTAYVADGVSLPAMRTRDATTGSYHRIAFEGEYEAMTGGNGVDGHDETSEDTRNTWEQEAGTAPTPGTVPPELTVSCP